MSLPFSSLTDEMIASKITPETITRAKYYLNISQDEHLIDKLQNYNLVITGTIGAGKSTICESVVHILKQLFPQLSLLTYPEFLYVNNNRLSSKLLAEKIHYNITSNTFQSYVLDSWWNIMNQNKDKQGFKLFERCIDDCVICFCNLENKHHTMNDLQLLSLYEDLKKLINQFDIPSYFSSSTSHNVSHFTRLTSTELNYNIQTIFSIIAADLHNGINNRIIGLYVEPEISKERIIMRSRTGESCYTDNQIEEYTNHYKKLFKMLEEGKRIDRFVDLGALL